MKTISLPGNVKTSFISNVRFNPDKPGLIIITGGMSNYRPNKLSLSCLLTKIEKKRNTTIIKK